MATLNRKALRDLWHLRGQALAIALIIATGVALLIMAQATLISLQHTQTALYAEQRFSDIWVNLKRAPNALLLRLADIPGVAEVEGRTVSSGKLLLDHFDEPVQALVQSLPTRQNLLFVRAGRLPQHADEILISDAFAAAHNLQPGTHLRATIHGRAQRFTISGIASSAEHLYQVKPGSLFPDFKRYAIVWMDNKALAAALDMTGAFNQAVLRLNRPDAQADVMAALDRLLARYGATGALGRMAQTSHAILDGEFQTLSSMATLFPTIFLAVAAFLLNMVFKRLIGMQREQIAILKAFGYTTAQVAVHYMLIVTLITLLGAALGIAAGAWMGQGLAALYQESFHFPYLHFRLDPTIAGIGIIVSLAAALGGTLHAVYRAAREPVAQAMRPPAPARFRQTLLERAGLARLLSPGARMVWRQLERRPGKAFFTLLALAFASAIVMLAQFQRASIHHLTAVEFRLAARYDIAATFVEVRPERALHELRSSPGVQYAEGLRSVAVRLSHDNRSKLVSLTGMTQHAQLQQLIDTRLQHIILPETGIVLDDMLADLLGVAVGESIQVDILEGKQQRLRLTVVARVPSYAGLSAYMALDTLNRLLGDGALINSARLIVSAGEENAVLHALDARPHILGAEARDAGLAALQDMMDKNMGIFTNVILIMGFIVNIGVLYNTVRMNLSEQRRELASLRVLGFGKGDIAWILFGELAILVVLSIPLGLMLGYALSALIAYGMQNELYRIPFIIHAHSYSYTALVTLISATLCALAASRELNRLDLVEVLKTRE